MHHRLTAADHVRESHLPIDPATSLIEAPAHIFGVP
jgi:hypothetical protein